MDISDHRESASLFLRLVGFIGVALVVGIGGASWFVLWLAGRFGWRPDYMIPLGVLVPAFCTLVVVGYLAFHHMRMELLSDNRDLRSALDRERATHVKEDRGDRVKLKAEANRQACLNKLDDFANRFREVASTSRRVQRTNANEIQTLTERLRDLEIEFKRYISSDPLLGRTYVQRFDMERRKAPRESLAIQRVRTVAEHDAEIVVVFMDEVRRGN